MIAKLRDISQSNLSLAAGVSRQAVSLWFRAPDPSSVNIQSRHLESLGRALGLSIDELARPLPVLGDPALRARLETAFLWDRLFPALDDFAIAVAQGDPRALARLVEIVGLYAAEQMAGRQIWLKFDAYEKYIPPARRRELERLWKLESSLAKS